MSFQQARPPRHRGGTTATTAIFSVKSRRDHGLPGVTYDGGLARGRQQLPCWFEAGLLVEAAVYVGSLEATTY